MVEKDNKALKEGSILASLTQATKKLPKPKKVKNPKATERLYYQLLNKLIRRAQDTFRDIVVPVGKGEPMRYNADATKPQDNFSFILEALAAWQKKVNEEIFTPENIERISERVSDEVNRRNKRELEKTYDKIIEGKEFSELESYSTFTELSKKDKWLFNLDVLRGFYGGYSY